MQERYRIIPAFPEFLAKWKNAQTLTPQTAVNPSVLLASEDGGLLQEAVQELTEALVTAGAVRTAGTLPCVNISLRRQKNFEEEFQRMYITLKNYAGFCNEFKGIVAVDLSDWAGGALDEDLDAVLSYLKDTQQDRFYLFYATTGHPEKLRTVLQLYFAVELHSLRLDQATDLLRFAVGKLEAEYGVTVDNLAEVALMQLVKEVSGAEDYRGVASVRSLCRDMAYRLMTDGSRLMDAQFLSRYKQQMHPKTGKRSKSAVGLIK